ncbi:unnamed protein product [Paramecium sonneborni]|uniref:Tetratricopeptide repeat protein n=1 Tax=Paramecium sonneborni TaxID=65129 RepID=A0A8S1RUH4_9CILI|nr:unnamed protein product [Paramecium sonneborni]
MKNNKSKKIMIMKKMMMINFNYKKGNRKMINEAETLLDQNRNEEVLQYINYAINSNPDEDIYYAIRAQILLNLNRNEEALEFFHYAINRNPNNDDYYVLKAHKLIQMNRNEEALEYIDHAMNRILIIFSCINANEQKTNKHENILIILLIEILMKLIIILQKVNLKIITISHTLKQMNRNEEALKFFEYAVNRNPDSENYYVMKAYMLIQMNRNEESLKDIDHIIKRNPDIDRYQALKAHSLMLISRNEQALEYIDYALNRNPDNDQYQVNKGNLKNYQNARTLIQMN